MHVAGRRTAFAFTALLLAASAIPLTLLQPTVKAAVLYDSGNPTPAEQLVLEYINRARANPVAEGQRLGIDIHEGLTDPSLVGPRPPLAMNPILLSIARGHSSDMYNLNYFSHIDPNGTTPFDRMTNAGYNFILAGENIAEGTYTTAAELEDLLMIDEGTPTRGHRVNLLDINPYPCGSPPCIYSEIGIGYFEGMTSYGRLGLLTQDFGATAAGPFLLGVVYNDLNHNNFYDIGEGIGGVTITTSSGSYYAVTSSSGGYAIPIGISGIITVTASGQGFGPITQTLTLSGANVKLDFTPQAAVTYSTSSTPTSQSTTQTSTQIQSSTQSTTSITQTTTTQASSQSNAGSTTLWVTPSSFGGATIPGTITACGATYTNGQLAVNCGSNFTALANLPTPSAGWQFKQWLWAGGLMCSASSTNPVACTSVQPGGSLSAVYGAQITVATTPTSSATVSWNSCSDLNYGNGASFFSANYGYATVTACNIPSGYTIQSWSCTGALSCSGSDNSTTVAFTGPGAITLNLQTQAQTTTNQYSTTPFIVVPLNSTSTTASTGDGTYSTPEFTFNQTVIMIAAILGVFLLTRKFSRRKAR